MEPIQYSRALRRRWWVIAAAVLVASVAAWVTTAALNPAEAPRATNFVATTTLWNTQAPTIGQEVPLPAFDSLPTYLTLPQVASIAEQAMKRQGRPASQDSKVSAQADLASGLLDITATARSREEAVAVSTAYSHALVTYLDRLKQKKITLQQQVVQRQIRSLQKRGAGTDLVASLRATLSQLALDRTTPIPLAIYYPATAVRADPDVIQASGGIQVPKSLPLRIALAALFGLLAGVVLALVLERFDTRIRSSRAAEDAFGLPVLAEVPAISRKRRGTIVTASHPSSRAAGAFRLIGVGTARWTSNGEVSSDGQGSRAKTLLVTSPEARDGKTTVAANLAVALAQTGCRVLVVSCDLRRPAIHEVFGVPERPGLADALEWRSGAAPSAPEPELGTYLEPCSVVRVAVIPSGVASQRPGELLGSTEMQRFLERLKKITDVIVLDCAPLVVASDVVPLLPQADGVIIVARARKTRQQLAASTAALLERMGAPRAGVVLNDAKEFSIPLAKRRMYRPTREERRTARTDPPSSKDEPFAPDSFVESASGVYDAPMADAPAADDVPVLEDAMQEVEVATYEEPQPYLRPQSAAPSDGKDGSGRSETLVAERTVQIPTAEEAEEVPHSRIPPRLKSLQDELLELRTQLEGLQLELPDVSADAYNGSRADPA